MAAFKMSLGASVNGWNEVSGRPGELGRLRAVRAQGCGLRSREGARGGSRGLPIRII